NGNPADNSGRRRTTKDLHRHRLPLAERGPAALHSIQFSLRSIPRTGSRDNFGQNDSPPRRGGRGMTIFVANFDKKTEEADLKELFEDFGKVNDVYIRRDWDTGESLGYAFIEMPRDGEAEYAIEKLDGKRWNGRRLKVAEKQER